MSVVLYVLKCVFGLLGVSLTALFLLYKYRFRHWKKRGIPYHEPSIPFGSTGGMMLKKSGTDSFIDQYEATKHHVIAGGWMFFQPYLLINDPEILKCVMVKDFNHFSDRGIPINAKNDPLFGNLLILNGVEWRNLRVKLTPTFTSGKMKMMYGTVAEVADELINYLKPLADHKQVIIAKDVTGYFTMDVIASCAFGIKIDTFNNPDSEFKKMVTRVIRPSFLELIPQLIANAAPSLTDVLKIRVVPRDVEAFFVKTLKETVDHRRDNNIKRDDFLQLLIQLMDKGYLDDVDLKRGRTEEEHTTQFHFMEAAAQAFVFLAAGYETASGVMQFCLYELAKTQDVQKKLREEIDKVAKQHGDKLDFDAIQDMKYLERVVDETLRIHPTLPSLARKCLKEYKVPGTDYIIEKDTLLQIAIAGIHKDPKYYPDPEKFDPDRFLPEEIAKRPPCTYMPFGEGPRMCIGNRFGLMQTRAGIAHLIRHFQFDLTDETPLKITYDKKQFFATAEGGVKLRVSHRT